MFQGFQVAYLRKRVKVREVRRLGAVRQTVAYLLSRSARNVPHAAALATYDVTPLVEYAQESRVSAGDEGRGHSKDTRLERAIRRTFSAFFIKAIAHGLRHMPELNAFMDYAPWRTGGTIYLAEDVNLAFTVHTKMGVVRPIIRNPHLKDLVTVAREMRDLTRRARRTDPEELYRKAGRAYMLAALGQLDIGALRAIRTHLRLWLRRDRPRPEFRDVAEHDKLKVEDILGATCTVANIGTMMSGHQTVTVVIPPEVMMFGIGRVAQVPMVVDGRVVPRYGVTIVGTIDHRALDGGEVFPFNQELERYFKNPALIYEWKPGDEI